MLGLGGEPKLPGVRNRLLALAVFALVSACRASESEPDASGQATPAVATADAAEVVPAAAAAKPKRRERPLPAFSGYTLGGEKLEISSLIGKRLLLFFFNPEVKDAPALAKAVAAIAPLRGPENFEILGVAMGSSPRKANEFVAAQGLEFRVIDDSTADIARRLGLRSPLAMLGVDSGGYLVFGFAQFPTEGPRATQAVESMLREALRLPAIAVGAEPVLGSRPPAPDFLADVMDSEEAFDLSAHRGRPVVLVFFLHTCPHCHDLLEFMKEALPTLPEEKRPVFVGVEITGRTGAVRSELAKKGLDYFPVLFDDDGSIREAYGVFAGVPDLFLIDAEGRIVTHVDGWRTDRDPPLMRMRLAQLSGAPVPMLLRADGFSGNETCGVCHQAERETWLLTNHSSAFDTLVKHGAESDEECVSCHVVGHGEAGGYESGDADLENVGCESCHGRGGPHLSPGIVADRDYSARCLTCHDEKHSLGFEYASFLPRVSHAANAHLAALPLEEKQKILAERGLPRKNVLPTSAAHVGSDACQSCHAAEYATWSAGAHAVAGGTLVEANQADTAECMRCHTTGLGRPGGFPEDARIDAHVDLGRVGCESCHGPGGDHVAKDAPKIGTIVSLGDKCDSCVILQICGGCHDDANDPGFEFEVEAKIERQRHGTIEPGTGKPKQKSARRAPGATVEGLLSHAFSLADRRS